ncbi:ATP-binding cassette domain-containing protein [Ramlibacter terrae]|uniref:ATP-binding cassette domain-containing protein n=1 Tax=Ramlibacter terrae TaxID=2732511 RepID=A0ABX6P148_9BURK|nr:ATP-binding cassette domain-containing protein [Ramlibacter terrae]
MSEVWAAVEEVGMAEAIHAMPMGLQTLSDGARLSGGREQLLLIARALLQRPRLLVLDEATNAIPDAAQARLLARLRTRGITCIPVTHRASALQAMDRVLVLDGGRLAWSGTPAALRTHAELDTLWRGEQQEGHL